MSNKTRSITRTQKKAQKKAQKKEEDAETKLRNERVTNCDKDLNKLLEERNCTMLSAVSIGGQWVPVKDVLNLPVTILISSK